MNSFRRHYPDQVQGRAISRLSAASPQQLPYLPYLAQVAKSGKENIVIVMTPFLDHIDHIVMTVENVDTTINWYLRVLGLRSAAFGEGRKALLLNKQKINLHQKGAEFEPRASLPTPGSQDICFISTTPLDKVIEHLKTQRVAIEKGPIKRNGATGLITSIYIRDPDQNLLEISNLG